mmetsp:Transcript_4733/g.10898  ORF Transcript_4733/g.10898 Transcript_4733/m.10898 type:complete len:218 (+) Transcript_4733:626-1279(+)
MFAALALGRRAAAVVEGLVRARGSVALDNLERPRKHLLVGLFRQHCRKLAEKERPLLILVVLFHNLIGVDVQLKLTQHLINRFASHRSALLLPTESCESCSGVLISRYSYAAQLCELHSEQHKHLERHASRVLGLGVLLVLEGSNDKLNLIGRTLDSTVPQTLLQACRVEKPVVRLFVKCWSALVHHILVYHDMRHPFSPTLLPPLSPFLFRSPYPG